MTTHYIYLFAFLSLQQYNYSTLLHRNHVLIKLFSLMMTGQSTICCITFSIACLFWFKVASNIILGKDFPIASDPRYKNG